MLTLEYNIPDSITFTIYSYSVIAIKVQGEATLEDKWLIVVMSFV